MGGLVIGMCALVLDVRVASGCLYKVIWYVVAVDVYVARVWKRNACIHRWAVVIRCLGLVIGACATNGE